MSITYKCYYTYCILIYDCISYVLFTIYVYIYIYTCMTTEYYVSTKVSGGAARPLFLAAGSQHCVSCRAQRDVACRSMVQDGKA